ncbi:dihydroxyacetone kinase phosphoryl donor subunit DhaM [Thermovenabulum gondwanense]|uniref:phosphoenolpyruvate--glycerone phosphotransferase n=1 Tax=Thermovenabulum gondwanense TaxID=520767 RepID=A0A162MEG7_9FIRM|nr:dihydroxyacetone kinase phosphoryl donor subunit DhaM [Thermovenabulum gondwanense]KYO65479.1 PTS-dependent dihydroxyacetone kinase, phosphotransferase subunit DhaM [Thermovenabulum gondwanense]
MVSILLVSHSTKIAEGTLELIKQMTQEKVRIEIAAGTTDGRLGTNACLIEEKIKEMWTEDGVLIFVDLGSAVMSAQMALEDLEEGVKNKVFIVDAPFIEGALIAAVEASIGKNIYEVKNAAEEAKNMNKI